MPLLILILDICRLRRAPQDLPYSSSLLVAAAAATVCLHLAAALYVGMTIGNVVLGAMLSLGVTLLALRAILSVRDFRNRFVQTASALLLCSLVFTILCLPIVLSFPPEVLAGTQELKPENLSPIHGLLVLIVIWKIIVDAHIFRHSLDLPFASGLVIAVLWMVLPKILAGLVGGAPPS